MIKIEIYFTIILNDHFYSIIVIFMEKNHDDVSFPIICQPGRLCIVIVLHYDVANIAASEN